MSNLTVKQAHSLLMDEDIKPMTAVTSDEDALSGDSAEGRLGADSADAADGSPASSPEGGDAGPQGEEGQSDGERSFEEGTVGLGVDIVEIDRMENILSRRPKFAEQVFSLPERLYCDRQANPATHYALRFAAKEAVVKALGTGFSDGIWVNDIEVERDKKGRPYLKLYGRALEVSNEQGVREMSLSLSYTRNDAVACVMAVTDSAIRATEKRKDPMEELTRQFKETRKMLDEL